MVSFYSLRMEQLLQNMAQAHCDYQDVRNLRAIGRANDADVEKRRAALEELRRQVAEAAGRQYKPLFPPPSLDYS